MQLNQDYYKQLIKKYGLINTISIDSEKRFPLLSLQMILHQCRNKKDMHINFQSEESLMNLIARNLFVQLSNEIFCNAADFPQLNIGDKVKSKKEIHVGMGVSEICYTLFRGKLTTLFAGKEMQPMLW